MAVKFEGFRKKDSLSNANAFYKVVKKQQKVDIKKKTRKAPVIKYRRFFYKFMQEVCKEPLTTIGAYLDQDHATALHSIRKADEIFTRRSGEKREYELLKAAAMGIALPEVKPDEKDKFIEELKNRLEINNSLLCNYQSRIFELENSFSKTKFKMAQMHSKNSELREELRHLKSEMKSIYQAYKKERGIKI